MKNSPILSQIRRHYLKLCFLPAVLLILSVSVLAVIPRGNLLFPRHLNSRSDYEKFYNRDLSYVEVTVPVLSYTGCARTVKGRITGYYYYTAAEDLCQFYLLSPDTPGAGSSVLEDTVLRGRLIRLEESEYRSLLHCIAGQIGWTASSLAEMASPYAISVLKTPSVFRLVLWLLAFGSFLLSLADLLVLAGYLRRPVRSPAFRRFRETDEQ